MKVIVCGGRDYANAEMLNLVLDEIHAKTPITMLIQGGAKGADSLAFDWGLSKPSVHVRTVFAEWDTYGRKAGPMRNAEMLKLAPDLVVAFPGGRGTADMVRQTLDAGVRLIEIPT